MKFFCSNAFDDKDKLVPGLTSFGALTYKGALIFEAYYSNSALILVKDYSKGRKIYRLANDKASALILRRLKFLLGLFKDEHTTMTTSELHSKLSEIIAEAMADNLDHLLTGEAR